MNLGHALLALVALVVATAAISLGLLSFFADREEMALLFVAGGVCLTAWSAFRVSARSR